MTRDLLIERWNPSETKTIKIMNVIFYCWKNDKDQFHREGDQPAIIRDNGSQEWYTNGKLHRKNDKPAIIFSNGEMQWYKNGKAHRDDDRPAVIRANGGKEWWRNGEFVKRFG